MSEITLRKLNISESIVVDNDDKYDDILVVLVINK